MCFPRESNSRTSSKSTSQLLLGAGRPGYLDVNGERVELKCSPRGRVVQLEVSLFSSGGNSLMTSIALTKGNRMNIGSVVEELKNKKRGLDINSGANIGRQNSSGQFDYYLVILE